MDYYQLKYPDLKLTTKHPYYECPECRHRSPESCPCELIETIPCTDAHVEAVRRQTN